MDHKPPCALEVLITDILSKYQRMFAFILRLMRGNDGVWLFLLASAFEFFAVTHAIKAVHRMNRSSSRPPFQTLVKFRKLMLHFRFVAQSFISNLSAYVFDTAVGGIFGPFIERLAATAAAPSSAPHPCRGRHRQRRGPWCRPRNDSATIRGTAWYCRCLTATLSCWTIS